MTAKISLSPTSRGATRFVTGVLVTAAAGSGVLLATLLTPKYPTLEPTAQVAAVASGSSHTVACPGAFAQLGLNPADPGGTVPQGELVVTAFGAASAPLVRETGDSASYPSAYTAPLSTPLAASGAQTVNTETLRGLAAVSCAEPSTDQWLVGGRTTLGHSATVTVTNPGAHPATVKITAYTAEGQLTAGGDAGVLVQPGQARTISVNGLAPAAAELALRVEASGSAVTAVLGVSEIHDIRPFGLDLVPAQQPGVSSLVFPGVTSEHEPGSSDAAATPLNTLYLLAPENDGMATVTAVDATGANIPLTTVELVAGRVTPVELAAHPPGAALMVTGQTPLVGAVLGSSLKGGTTDMVWFTPAPELKTDQEHAVAVVPGGKLLLVNPGADTVTAALTDAAGGDATATVTLAPHSQQEVAAPSGTVVLKSSGALNAGVTLFTADGAAAYPVPRTLPQKTQVLVYND